MISQKENASHNSFKTVFEQLLEPIDEFVKKQDANLKRHHNQKLFYYDFFRILIYFFVSSEKSFKLFIVSQLNKDLLPKILNLKTVPYSTINEAFEHFPVILFREAFQYLLKTVPFKYIPQIEKLGKLYCIDGSLFPVISSMVWAQYTSTHQSLKFHLCFELNRMLPVEFFISAANYSERKALINMLQSGITYIADRGYMSFQLCYRIVQSKAYFIFRIRAGLVYTVKEILEVQLPVQKSNIFENVTDNLINYMNDEFGETYRLVSFSISQDVFYILTNRMDLTTFQIIMLYAYRWQIELMFRFLKRTMNGIHLIKQCQHGVTIQFYIMLIVALLQLRLKQISIQKCDEKYNFHQVENSKKSIPGKLTFLETIGKNLKKYWKIGIHWLTALKNLLSAAFDARAIKILNTS